nr:helix-turn-helix domain-containing protein [uncultured Sphaerochaeta sp.]
MDEYPEVMNVDEAAKYLKLSPSTVRNYIRNKKIPYRRAFKGARVTFSKSILEEWMRETSIKPNN